MPTKSAASALRLVVSVSKQTEACWRSFSVINLHPAGVDELIMMRGIAQVFLLLFSSAMEVPPQQQKGPFVHFLVVYF